MNKRRGLGRGLSALIPDTSRDKNDPDVSSETSVEQTVSRETSMKDVIIPQEAKEDSQTRPTEKRGEEQESEAFEFGTLKLLNIEQVEADPNQPRRDFDSEALQALADSIHSQGLLQPIVVNRIGVDQYRIVAGERRWRAAKLTGLKEVPCLIRELEDEDVLQISLIENIQREDLNVIEEAEAYRRLTEDFYYTHQEISRLIGKSRSHITNTLRLLQLPTEIQTTLIDRIITPGHARAILSLSSLDDQLALLNEIESRQLNVRQAERLAERFLHKEEHKEQTSKQEMQKDAQFLLAVQSVEDELCQHLGTKVRLRAGKERGQIVVDYYSHEDLGRILQLLGLAEDSGLDVSEA